jgi:hypothetical protein
MVQNLVFPSSQRLRVIEQELIPVLTADDPIFDIFPVQEEDDDLLRWEQLDNYGGLQQLRGINGMPPRIARVGQRSYVATPGYYGEFGHIDEREITKRRKIGTMGDPIDITEPVLQVQEQLLLRRLNRIRQISWLLAMTGTFAVSNAQGVLMHTDAYTMQTYTALVPWATVATARPLADLRLAKLLGRGRSVIFDARSRLYINAVTANNLMMNQNANDLFGRRIEGGNTANSLANINAIFLANDLPQVAVYDEGYLDDSGTFQLFIPNATGLLVGRRTTGAALGAYRMTRNANNPDAGPGPYTRVIDNIQTTREVPRQINVHDGHNGGPVLFYPSALVRMSL